MPMRENTLRPRQRADRCHAAAGVTLLELLISMAVGSIILGGIFSMILVSQVSSAELMLLNKVEQNAQLAILKIENDLIDSSVECPDWSLADGATANQITFNRCTGSADGQKIWSTPVTYQLQGQNLVRTQNGTTIVQSSTLTALSFTLDSGMVLLSTTASDSHRDRFTHTSTATLDVTLRN